MIVGLFKQTITTLKTGFQNHKRSSQSSVTGHAGPMTEKIVFASFY
ncbi:hypothetical protein HMPREF9103_00554 [Lentilactobacillus parafarraginis F0439]|uniref:Uncharacterized protein n=1 Tax=Lentilactobacillus parafarraginis F0439 TaxID=797515 RepID=G9ZLF6_9LACO|nr:hypothetical protein HMPREF9103_00554 [Lentilactobacillus parafarraginis F0439]